MDEEDPAKDICREEIEAAVLKYARAVEDITMPVIEDWVIVTTFSDLNGERHNGKWMTLRPKGSWSHRAIGLMTVASDDLRGLTMEPPIED